MSEKTDIRRLALITGAGQGIGLACAETLASAGTDLILMDRNGETVRQAARNLTRPGASVTAEVVDVTDHEATAGAYHRAVAEAGPVNILVNNAGFDRPGGTAKISLDDFEAVLRVHLTAALGLIQLALPGMRAAGWGRIINIGSIYGLAGAKGEVAYSTAKAGLIGLTKSVAQEAGGDGVTVNAVLPGLTRTPTIERVMADKYKAAIIAATPAGRMAEAEEVAAVVAFLASPAASFVNAAAIPVSGGWAG